MGAAESREPAGFPDSAAGLNLRAMSYNNSPSGIGLTNAITRSEYLDGSSSERRTLLRNALSRRNRQSHEIRAVNFAISYEGRRLTPSEGDGEVELDKMLRHILERNPEIGAFRLWYDKLYQGRESEPHILSQRWIKHGLTPYAKYFVLVLGGEEVAEESTRGWVQCEMGAAKLHWGYAYVEGGSVWTTAGMGERWNSEEGSEIAGEILNGLQVGSYSCKKSSEKELIMELMRQFAHGVV